MVTSTQTQAIKEWLEEKYKSGKITTEYPSWVSELINKELIIRKLNPNDPKVKASITIGLIYGAMSSVYKGEIEEILNKEELPISISNNIVEYPKAGRNENCSCGSGIKYKKCHGK